MKRNLGKILLANAFVITLATFVLMAGILCKSSVLEEPESRIYDLLMGTLHGQDDSPVVIVGIDEKSIEKLGPLPWPRAIIADAVHMISQGGAKAIGLGLLFADREMNPGLQEVKNLQEAWQAKKGPAQGSETNTFDKLFDAAITRLDHDARLIDAIRASRNIVLPFEFLPAQSSETLDGQMQLSGLMRLNSLPLSENSAADDPAISRIKDFSHIFRRHPRCFGRIRETYRELAGKASALGHINLSVDADGVVRKLPLLIDHQGRYFPSLSLQLVAKCRELNIKSLSLSPSHGSGAALRLGNTVIPIDEDRNMLIRYRNSASPIPEVSMADVLDNTVEPMRFKHKIVLIGRTSASRTVSFPTPPYCAHRPNRRPRRPTPSTSTSRS